MSASVDGEGLADGRLSASADRFKEPIRISALDRKRTGSKWPTARQERTVCLRPQSAVSEVLSECRLWVESRLSA
jgi:hypothetical protein